MLILNSRSHYRDRYKFSSSKNSLSQIHIMKSCTASAAAAINTTRSKKMNRNCYRKCLSSKSIDMDSNSNSNGRRRNSSSPICEGSPLMLTKKKEIQEKIIQDSDDDEATTSNSLLSILERKIILLCTLSRSRNPVLNETLEHNVCVSKRRSLSQISDEEKRNQKHDKRRRIATLKKNGIANDVFERPSSESGIAKRVHQRYYLRQITQTSDLEPQNKSKKMSKHLLSPTKIEIIHANTGRKFKKSKNNNTTTKLIEQNKATKINCTNGNAICSKASANFSINENSICEDKDKLRGERAMHDCVTPSICQMIYTEDMNELVRNITREAKALVQAEICSLFLLDKEHSELVAEVFEKNGTSDEYLTEIRMPLTQGIVGHVATTGQMLNVKNVYENPYFYPKVDERTGFVTRNILCFPIKDEKDNLVGVAELCNKIGKKSFTRHDEQCAATFSVYCALSILHCLLYRKLQEAHRRSHMAAELLVQGSTLSIAPEDILRLTVRDIPLPTSFHPEFTHFSFVPRSIGTGDTYVEASLSMFKDLGFIDRYRLRRRTLARFLLMVQKGYRDVPYHNWSHAFAVGHFCYLLIRIPAIKAALTELERFALLVACLCHDIDHRGTTNAFQLQSKTPLAQLYSSEGSVLERHHFAQTVTILGMDECNIFDQLTRQQYQNVLDYIRDIILATDIAAHLRKVAQISKMVHDGYNIHDPNDHHRLMCLLMTASDLSDQSKDFKNSKAIAENIYKEFFSQGDLEKQMGNNPIEMMDRDRACVPKIQLEFMDTVAIPVFEYLSLMLPELRSTFDALELNRKCWTALAEILMEDGYSTGGLDYLRDPELERRVFARLAQKQSLARTQSQSTVRRNTPSIASVLGLTNSGGSRDDNDQELSPRSTRSTTTTTTGSTTENTSARSTTTSFPLSSSSSTEIIQIDTTKAPAVFKQKSKKSKIQ